MFVYAFIMKLDSDHQDLIKKNGKGSTTRKFVSSVIINENN